MDGTCLFQELFQNKPKQNGLKSDPDHLHGKQILEFISTLNSRKIIINNVTHLPEKTHKELQKLLPKKMFVAYDGMKLTK